MEEWEEVLAVLILTACSLDNQVIKRIVKVSKVASAPQAVEWLKANVEAQTSNCPLAQTKWLLEE